MTNWTTPLTWSAANVPTAAQLNAQWRDNLLHLKETVDGFGFPYAPCDPRLISTGSYQFVYPFYARVAGRGLTHGAQFWINTSAGNITIGAYRNLLTETVPKGQPGARIATTTSVACPAAGLAVLAWAEFAAGSPVQIEPGDWFAWAGTSGTAFGKGGRGSTGWELFGIEAPVVIFVDVNKDLNDLPDTADPDFSNASGSASGLCVVGIS
jgi:hypothetical protein